MLFFSSVQEAERGCVCMGLGRQSPCLHTQHPRAPVRPLPARAGTVCWGSLRNRICSPFHPGVGAQRSNVPVVHLEVNADCSCRDGVCKPHGTDPVGSGDPQDSFSCLSVVSMAFLRRSLHGCVRDPPGRTLQDFHR